MLSKRKIKAIEKQTQKRLKKHYRPGAYFYVEGVELSFHDMEGLFTLSCRAGYEYEKEGETKYNSITLEFNSAEEVVRNTGEFATILYHKVVAELDEYDHFTVR